MSGWSFPKTLVLGKLLFKDIGSRMKKIIKKIFKSLQEAQKTIIPFLCDIIFVFSGVLVIAMVLIFIAYIFQPFASFKMATSEELIHRMGEIKDSLWEVLLPSLMSFMAVFLGKEFLSGYKEKIGKTRNENIPDITNASKNTAMLGNYIGKKRERKYYLGLVGQPIDEELQPRTEVGCDWDNTPQWESECMPILYEGMDTSGAQITPEQLTKIGKGDGERLNRRWNYIYSIEDSELSE
jgi:hypothetical protein